MIETEEQQIKRISESIDKLLKREGLAFGVKMIPQITISRVPEVKKDVLELEPDDSAPK